MRHFLSFLLRFEHIQPTLQTKMFNLKLNWLYLKDKYAQYLLFAAMKNIIILTVCNIEALNHSFNTILQLEYLGEFN